MSRNHDDHPNDEAAWRAPPLRGLHTHMPSQHAAAAARHNPPPRDAELRV